MMYVKIAFLLANLLVTGLMAEDGKTHTLTHANTHTHSLTHTFSHTQSVGCFLSVLAYVTTWLILIVVVSPYVSRLLWELSCKAAGVQQSDQQPQPDLHLLGGLQGFRVWGHEEAAEHQRWIHVSCATIHIPTHFIVVLFVM